MSSVQKVQLQIRGGAEGCYYTHRGDGIQISIFRAFKPPSFLNLSRLKPSQNGVDARSDRNMLVHLDLDAHLSQAVSGSETWRFRTLLEDARGLCRTWCHCLANRPPNELWRLWDEAVSCQHPTLNCKSGIRDVAPCTPYSN